MRPLSFEREFPYPEGGFENASAAQSWADRAAPYLDARDYYRVEQCGEKFVVVQDVRAT